MLFWGKEAYSPDFVFYSVIHDWYSLKNFVIGLTNFQVGIDYL